MPSQNAAQIISNLLARGATHAQAAAAADVSVGYVSQLLSDAEFCAAIEIARLAHVEDSGKRDSAAGRIYDKTLLLQEKLIDALTVDSKFMKPMDKARLLQTILTVKAPPPTALDPHKHAATMVQITLPVIAAMDFTLSPTKEIVGLGSTAFAPMPTSQLKALAQNREHARQGSITTKQIFDLDVADLDLEPSP